MPVMWVFFPHNFPGFKKPGYTAVNLQRLTAED